MLRPLNKGNCFAGGFFLLSNQTSHATNGRCGIDGAKKLTTPTLVEIDGIVSKVACGWSHTLAIAQQKTLFNVYSFGRGDHGIQFV
jgi:hypothetical protein